MKIQTATAAILITADQPYPDASGFPARVQCGPYVFAADFIGGEVRISAAREVSGMRVERRIAVDRCTAAYTKLLHERTSQEWRIANGDLYS